MYYLALLNLNKEKHIKLSLGKRPAGTKYSCQILTILVNGSCRLVLLNCVCRGVTLDCLRFTPSAAHPPWSGTLQAISYGPACPQQFPHNINNKTEALKTMTRKLSQIDDNALN